MGGYKNQFMDLLAETFGQSALSYWAQVKLIDALIDCYIEAQPEVSLGAFHLLKTHDLVVGDLHSAFALTDRGLGIIRAMEVNYEIQFDAAICGS